MKIDMPGALRVLGGANPGMTFMLENGWRVKVDNMTQEEVRSFCHLLTKDIRLRVDFLLPPSEGNEP